MQPTNHQPNEQQSDRSCAGSLITSYHAWPQWQITRAEKLERQTPSAFVPNVFEIVCSHRFTASPVSLFPQVADTCDDESARTATLAGGFFFYRYCKHNSLCYIQVSIN
jgi:hypothetical protein